MDIRAKKIGNESICPQRELRKKKAGLNKTRLVINLLVTWFLESFFEKR